MQDPWEESLLVNESFDFENTSEDAVELSHHCGKENNAQSTKKNHIPGIMEIDVSIDEYNKNMKECGNLNAKKLKEKITKLTLEYKANVDDKIKQMSLEIKGLQDALKSSELERRKADSAFTYTDERLQSIKAQYEKRNDDQVKKFTFKMNEKDIQHKEELNKKNEEISMMEKTVLKMQRDTEEMLRKSGMQDDLQIMLREDIKNLQGELNTEAEKLYTMDRENWKLKEKLQNMSRKSEMKEDIEPTLRRYIDEQRDELTEKNKKLWKMKSKISTLQEEMEHMSMQIEDKEERAVMMREYFEKELKETNEKLRVMESQNFKLKNESQMMLSRLSSQVTYAHEYSSGESSTQRFSNCSANTSDQSGLMLSEQSTSGDCSGMFVSFPEDQSSILTSTDHADGESADIGNVTDSSRHNAADPDDTIVKATLDLPGTEMDRCSTSTKSSGPPSEE